jgi:hypothetical protein
MDPEGQEMEIVNTQKDTTNFRSLVPESVPPSSEELDPDEPTRSPPPRLPVRDTEVISDK